MVLAPVLAMILVLLGLSCNPMPLQLELALKKRQPRLVNGCVAISGTFDRFTG